MKLLGSRFVTEDQRARFRREAESIARLEHPGVAQVYEADVDADPPYIAMRFVEGVDLGSAVAAELTAEEGARRVGSPVPVRPEQRADVHRVLRFFEKAARALHAAHEAGVVHRDVKPGNIMVTGVGDPVLLDFGLARDERGSSGRGGEPVLTREGDVFGTLAYMAPEQLRGETERVDARADIWALGVTLFEVLTGQRPFDGEGPAALAIAIDQGQRRSLRALNRAIPSDAVVVVETALEPSQERRYRTALALAEDLRRVCEYEPIQAIPAGPGLRLRRWCRREPAWAVAIFGSVVGPRARADRLADRARAEPQARRSLSGALQGREDAGDRAGDGVRALALGIEAVERHDVSVTRSVLVRPLLDLTLDARFQLVGAAPGKGSSSKGTGRRSASRSSGPPRVWPWRRWRSGVCSWSGTSERRPSREHRCRAAHFSSERWMGVSSPSIRRPSRPAEVDTGDEAVTDLVAPRADVAAALVGKTRIVVFEPGNGDVRREIDLAEHGTFGALHAAVLPAATSGSSSPPMGSTVLIRSPPAPAPRCSTPRRTPPLASSSMGRRSSMPRSRPGARSR